MFKKKKIRKLNKKSEMYDIDLMEELDYYQKPKQKKGMPVQGSPTREVPLSSSLPWPGCTWHTVVDLPPLVLCPAADGLRLHSRWL